MLGCLKVNPQSRKTIQLVEEILLYSCQHLCFWTKDYDWLFVASTSRTPSQNICISITSSTREASKALSEMGPECDRTGTKWFAVKSSKPQTTHDEPSALTLKQVCLPLHSTQVCARYEKKPLCSALGACFAPEISVARCLFLACVCLLLHFTVLSSSVSTAGVMSNNSWQAKKYRDFAFAS